MNTSMEDDEIIPKKTGVFHDDFINNILLRLQHIMCIMSKSNKPNCENAKQIKELYFMVLNNKENLKNSFLPCFKDPDNYKCESEDI